MSLQKIRSLKRTFRRSFVAANGSGDILIISSDDGVTWTANTQVGERTDFTPAMAAFKDKLVIFFVAKNGTGALLMSSSNDGVKMEP
ncbi:hypothetical protein [Dyadobacter fermentans]|nr:hypothetical protein [Dyadobacter fermentans]